MNKPRIIISGVSGKIGKTVATSAIISLLAERGYRVQPFKVGPDFIDPSYHNIFSSRPSRNLDAVMFRKEAIINSFCRAMRNSDIGVIEGVLGLYDSVDGVTERGSTAELSKILKAPVVLIVDAERINRGLLAIVKGFLEFDRSVKIGGIIVNNVANERQGEKIVKAFREKFNGLEIVGVIHRSDIIKSKMGYRHLGLVPTSERVGEIKEIIQAIKSVGQQIDVDKIVEIASNVDEICPASFEELYPMTRCSIRIGVIRDKIFSFYYPENIEYFETVADRVYYIDSVNDSSLPDIDLLYIGGGFPEVYASLLEKNKPLKKDIKKKYEGGLKIYAECGGLIYLSERVIAFDGGEYMMAGLIDGYVEMYRRPVGHGYVYLSTIKDNPLTSLNQSLVGHEFHHSRLVLKEDVDFAFKVERGYGVDGIHDGVMKENLLAMYTHIHVLHNAEVFRKLMMWPHMSQR
ncbi:MAG: cobyrinate a,c-diamide synthase [Nitrososphaerota archaeon]